MPIENRLNMGLAKASYENTPEFVFFQKLLILQRQFAEMDLKDFQVLGDYQKQDE